MSASKFDLIYLKQLFETAHTKEDYAAAKKRVRLITTDEAWDLVDAMIDAKLRIQLDTIAREGL